MAVGRQNQWQNVPGAGTSRFALPAQFHAELRELEEEEMIIISCSLNSAYYVRGLICGCAPHLGYFDIYRIANYCAVAAAVSGVGNQLPVPDPVIMSTVRTLTEDGNGGSAEQFTGMSVSNIRK